MTRSTIFEVLSTWIRTSEKVVSSVELSLNEVRYLHCYMEFKKFFSLVERDSSISSLETKEKPP